MPRISSRPAQPRGTRAELLTAWVNRNRAQCDALGGKGQSFVHNRLRTLVGDTAGLFSDIEPGVQTAGRGGKVGWSGEPYASDGSGSEQFKYVLDLLGQLAVALVAEALAELEGGELFSALVDAGLPAGRVKPQIGWQVDRRGGGERLMGLFGQQLVARPDLIDPLPIQTWVGRARAAIVDPAIASRARREFVARAVSDLQLFTSVPATEDPAPGDELSAIVADAVRLCRLECGDARARQPLSANGLEVALKATIDRWTGRGRRVVEGGMTRPMKVRLAHTLIDPDYYKSVGGGRSSEALTQRLVRAHPNSAFEIDFEQAVTPFVLMYQWFLDQGYRAFKGQARRFGLPPGDLDDLLQDNWEDARARLLRKFADSYIDPDRAPDDWDRVLRNVTTLRSVEELLESKKDDGIAYDRQGDGEDPAVNPFDKRRQTGKPGAVQVHHDFDAVENGYWCTRDQDLLTTKEYQEFRVNCPYVRQPFLAVAEIGFLAGMLVDRAADEVGFVASRPSPTPGDRATVWYAFDKGDADTVSRGRRLRGERLSEVRFLLDKHLKPLLLAGYRQIPKTTGANQERVDSGESFAGIDIPAAFMFWKPAGRDRAEWAELALVAKTAVHRAVYLVLGRAAMAADPDQGNADDYAWNEDQGSYDD